MNTGHTATMINKEMPAQPALISEKKIELSTGSLFILLLLANSTFASGINEDAIKAGKKIYIEGKLASGEDVIATTVSDVQLTGEQAACVNCHRHSGLGSNEGSTIASAITGKILFSERKIKAHRYFSKEKQQSSSQDRPAYTASSLKNTLLTGVTNNGNQLDILMPKYTLGENDYNHLYAYLNSLSIVSPGVTDTTLHIATIVDERVSTTKSNTMLRTLEEYISALNSGTRNEKARAEQAPIQKEWQYQGYRKFKLHVWTLTGTPDTWQEQLNKYYDEHPVFAVVSGISKDSWEKVDTFCNTREVPCILPNILTPGFSDKNFYTLYFNAGPNNDANVIARYFHTKSTDSEKTNNIVQLYDAASYSLIASNTLQEEITSNGKHSITSVSLDEISDNPSINQYIKNENTNVVIWSEKLDASLLAKLSSNKDKIKSIFIPYYLATSAEERKKLNNIGIEVLTAYPYVKPSKEMRATIRSSIWARSRKIDTTEKVVFTNTFTAVNLLIDAIKHVRSYFSRPYIIEILEHMIDRAVLTGMYPKLTIGPSQRYASRGGYIMKVTDDTSAPLQPISEWLLPEKQVKLIRR